MIVMLAIQLSLLPIQVFLWINYTRAIKQKEALLNRSLKALGIIAAANSRGRSPR